MTPNRSTIRAAMVFTVASSAHKTWQETYRAENPEAPARWKPADDLKWFWDQWDRNPSDLTLRVVNEAGEDVTEIDILNRPYEELSPRWQAENKAMAEVACDLVLNAAEDGCLTLNGFVEWAADKVHIKWLERNGAYAPVELQKPYDQLSETNKEKDRLWVRKAIRAYLVR